MMKDMFFPPKSLPIPLLPDLPFSTSREKKKKKDQNKQQIPKQDTNRNPNLFVAFLLYQV